MTVQKDSRNKTHIICILDSSGSMSSMINEAIEGFNQFLEEQKASGKRYDDINNRARKKEGEKRGRNSLSRALFFRPN